MDGLNNAGRDSQIATHYAAPSPIVNGFETLSMVVASLVGVLDGTQKELVLPRTF